MEQITEQLIVLGQKDYWDKCGIIIPITLTILIFIQNIVFYIRDRDLKKKIYNREERNRYHDDILLVYNTYYDFCDCILTSGFANHVRMGNCNMAIAWMNNVIYLRQNIGRKRELARLLFKKSDDKLYGIIESRFDLALRIIDKYVDYINSGKMYLVSENAWNTIYQNESLLKYDYQRLLQNEVKYDSFVKLCQSDELTEIESLLKKYEGAHTYDEFDVYFEKYISLSEL